MQKKTSLLTLAAFSVCWLFWLLRTVKLMLIINSGFLPDFVGYYQAARSLISPEPDFSFIVNQSYGPPFVFILFLPLAFLALPEAELAITLINLVSYWLVFWLVWQLYFKKTRPVFWLILALMSFSFPLVYSLGMGNPIGLVTLGIYSFWLFKHKLAKVLPFLAAVWLKIYPVLIVPALWLRKSTKKDGWLALAGLFLGLGFSLIALPQALWTSYVASWQQITLNTKKVIDFAIYNQSFSSSLARLGLEAKFLSGPNIAFIFFLTSLLLAYLVLTAKKPGRRQLESVIVLLCFALLIHPFPWQYYFASLLPWLMVKIVQKKIGFVLAFLLISLDGNRLAVSGLIKGLLDSSQFLAALLIFLMITLRPISVYFKSNSTFEVSIS